MTFATGVFSAVFIFLYCSSSANAIIFPPRRPRGARADCAVLQCNPIILSSPDRKRSSSAELLISSLMPRFPDAPDSKNPPCSSFFRGMNEWFKRSEWVWCPDDFGSKLIIPLSAITRFEQRSWSINPNPSRNLPFPCWSLLYQTDGDPW